MQPHEYAIIGHSRTSIGRVLGTIAGIISASAALIASTALQIAERMGWTDSLPKVILFPLTASVFYPLGHLAWNRWIWRWEWVSKLLQIPDLSGNWDCVGRTDGGAESGVNSEWRGTLRITQTWEKIRVYLDSHGSSGSKSVSASLLREPGRGFVLMYSYRNEPDISQTDMNPHIGYCEIVFEEGLTKARGQYFNNKGRVTYGHMTLNRREGGGND
jgi:hypothetical protein